MKETFERIEEAIKEITESGVYGNQVHQDTVDTILAYSTAEALEEIEGLPQAAQAGEGGK